MKQIDKIKEVLVGKEKMHYKDIAESTQININSTRAVLNGAVKKGEDFERLGEGYYKLK